MNVPTLSTARLVLRAPELGDYAASCALWSDPVVTRFVGGRAFPADEVWSRLLRGRGLWALLGYGYWTVLAKDDGRYVGEAGFADFRRPLDPPLDAPESGWAFTAAEHGKGFATEVVDAMCRWADAHVDAPHTLCLIAPEHTASLRVAEKCGYRRAREATYKGSPALVLQRPRRS